MELQIDFSADGRTEHCKEDFLLGKGARVFKLSPENFLLAWGCLAERFFRSWAEPSNCRVFLTFRFV